MNLTSLTHYVAPPLAPTVNPQAAQQLAALQLQGYEPGGPMGPPATSPVPGGGGMPMTAAFASPPPVPAGATRPGSTLPPATPPAPRHQGEGQGPPLVLYPPGYPALQQQQGPGGGRPGAQGQFLTNMYGQQQHQGGGGPGGRRPGWEGQGGPPRSQAPHQQPPQQHQQLPQQQAPAGSHGPQGGPSAGWAGDSPGMEAVAGTGGGTDTAPAPDQRHGGQAAVEQQRQYHPHHDYDHDPGGHGHGQRRAQGQGQKAAAGAVASRPQAGAPGVVVVAERGVQTSEYTPLVRRLQGEAAELRAQLGRVTGGCGRVWWVAVRMWRALGMRYRYSRVCAAMTHTLPLARTGTPVNPTPLLATSPSSSLRNAKLACKFAVSMPS